MLIQKWYNKLHFFTLDFYFKPAKPVGNGWDVPSWNSQVVSFQEVWGHEGRDVQAHDCRHSGRLLHPAVCIHHRRATVSVVKETGPTTFCSRFCAPPPHDAVHSPLDAPVDCGVVHLVDQDYQVLDAGRLGQHGVLPCLTALLEARLELAFPRRDDLRNKHIPSRLEMLKIKKEEEEKKGNFHVIPHLRKQLQLRVLINWLLINCLRNYLIKIVPINYTFLYG